MATAQGMSGIDVRAVAQELAEKLPLWIDKVYQFDTCTLGIRLNGEEHAKYQLLIESGRRAHLVHTFPEPPKNPPQYAMLLRKHLSGGKVLAIRQHGLERILIFDIGKHDRTYHLIIELYDEGNVILTDEAFKIIKPLRHHRFRDRDIVPNAIYMMSETDPTGSVDELSSVLKNDDRDIVRALAIGCMLGGTYAEYVCSTAGIDKTTPAASADPVPVFAALQTLFESVSCARNPVVSARSCEPVQLSAGDTPSSEFVRFSDALEAFFPVTAAVKKAAKPKISAAEKIRKYQQDAIKKFENKIARTEEQVAILYENYQLVAAVIAALDDASKTRSWQEIGTILKKNTLPVAQKIVAIYPEEAAVELELGQKIKIYVHEGVEQNAERYYATIKKFRRKKEGALAAMAKPLPKKKPMRHDIVAAKKLWYHRFRWFETSDGVVVLGGRDASQNEELVKKYMAGGDLFVHADVHGASVVIVKGKTERMDEVAQFAASYSGAWRSGHFSADVYAALPNQVSKTPESGEFVTRGSFIVRGERTYYRNVPVGVGIGLVLEPQAAVIGGPPSAIKPRAKVYVELKPGQYEPNDVAKKVLRLMKQGIPDEEEKALRGVLNTDRVAAFIPPGGSDITGKHES
jgi:predicted ribosome quality control (RQC) complex YloA/Tae2 family protein